jgi:hypothetical protein
MGHAIFSQARTLDRLYGNIKEAAYLHFKEQLEQGETLQVLILTETEVKGKFHVHGPQRSSSSLPDEEIQRRKALVKRMLEMRDELPALGMTTAELVRLAREERQWLDEG